MSKSKGNGVAPDTMAEKYGVDTLRLALMFGGPPESDLNFDENFPVSMKSFLDKVAKMTPLGRIGEVDDIANTVEALATIMRFTTGDCFVIDGGRTL
jgi:leucyl-tRNA synthetase